MILLIPLALTMNLTLQLYLCWLILHRFLTTSRRWSLSGSIRRSKWVCCSQPLCRSMNTTTVSPRDIKTYVGSHVCVPFFNSTSMVFQYHNKLAKFLFAIANPTIEPASVMLTFYYIISIYLFHFFLWHPLWKWFLYNNLFFSFNGR